MWVGRIAVEVDTLSDLWRGQFPQGPTFPRPAAEGPGPQGRTGAYDRVTGVFHPGELCPRDPPSGGIAHACRHPRVVGGGGRGLRLGDLSEAERPRPGQGSGPEIRLRLAAGPGDLGAPRIRTHRGDAAAPRTGQRAARAV